MSSMNPPWLRMLALAVPLTLAMACTDGSDTDDTGDTEAPAVDADGDGFDETEDCDDTNDAIYPGAPEDDCTDPVDYNCDGSVAYEDVDADGFAACEDCNDANADINAEAVEVCDGVDNDCDELVDDADDSVTDQAIWYADDDDDDFGDPEDTLLACDQPTGYVSDDSDCNDDDGEVFPGATEICDTVDNDCDELIDDADEDVVDQMEWFADEDGDELGDAENSLLACFLPEGYVDNDLDCDDADEFSGEATEWYNDADGDGYGLTSTRKVACFAPSGHVENDLDCNDRDETINPDGIEVCDRADNDCDGDIDDDDPDVTGTTDWFPDDDEDDFGDEDATPTAACVAPSGYVDDDTDCDDTEVTVNPDMPFDFDDDLDNDCDTSIDEDVGSETYTHDSDIQSIWNSRCTGCHGSSGGLSLASSAHGRIFEVGSSVSGYDYVTPGLPADSYLYMKVTGDSRISGSKMPIGGSLSSSDIAKIETWIEEGAVK